MDLFLLHLENSTFGWTIRKKPFYLPGLIFHFALSFTLTLGKGQRIFGRLDCLSVYHSLKLVISFFFLISFHQFQGMGGAVRDEILLQLTVPIMFVQVLFLQHSFVPCSGLFSYFLLVSC